MSTTTEVLAEGVTDAPLELRAVGVTRLVFQRVTIPPGDCTGWHTHPGPLLVVLEAGTLTHYDARGGVRVYLPGDAFEELPGRDEVHMGANHGLDPVVLAVTGVLPVGAPFRDDVIPEWTGPSSCCGCSCT